MFTVRRDAVIQPYQFDPELDPEGEAPEEIQVIRLQQDISEWLVLGMSRSGISESKSESFDFEYLLITSPDPKFL